MKFGQVADASNIDFILPDDHRNTLNVFNSEFSHKAQFSIGCAKWNKQDLKGFYPRGTTDELAYYASQFNSIELNATFYRIFPDIQFSKWYKKTPNDFVFFPKLVQDISHFSRLKEDSQIYVDAFLNNVSALKEKLGLIFLQMHNNFSPNSFPNLIQFVESWPKNTPLAIELRHRDWFNDPKISTDLFQLFEEYNVTNIIVDTAGRRDLLHMRLTSNKTFIRWVGANHASDYQRLDDWVNRISKWYELGLEQINFFIHQNIELQSPLLSQYFIKRLNSKLHLDLKVPKTLFDLEGSQGTLF